MVLLHAANQQLLHRANTCYPQYLLSLFYICSEAQHFIIIPYLNTLYVSIYITLATVSTNSCKMRSYICHSNMLGDQGRSQPFLDIWAMELSLMSACNYMQITCIHMPTFT